MSLTGNKGEWSEAYTFLKLLGDGYVYAGNENLEKIKDLFYPIIMIIREETVGLHNYVRNDKQIVIQTSDGDVKLSLDAKKFLNAAENLLKAIKNTKNKGSFSVKDIEDFLNQIYCHSLKAKSADKTDIRIVLHDRRTQIESEMGFSIKSNLGNNSTLLNASKATNFTYKIIGPSLTDDEIEKINTINTRNKVIDRVKEIYNKKCKLVFERVDNKIFRNNLTLIDSDLQYIISDMLLESFENMENNIKDLAEKLSEKNPLNYDMDNNTPYYSYKIKHFLTSVALGMMPATKWSGKLEANGGYLVVKDDGEILCYHFYDRNRFEEFIFANAYLERSSTSRHEYATIIKEDDGSLSFKLNLQIRLR